MCTSVKTTALKMTVPSFFFLGGDGNDFTSKLRNKTWSSYLSPTKIKIRRSYGTHI